MSKKISDYRIINHGIEHAQYFQGHGTSFTKWTDCATGCGNTAQEALSDALDMLAQDDWNVESIQETLDDQESAHDDCDEEDHDECELYFYVSVDVVGGDK